MIDHLINVIPGLKKYGLSETRVRYLFKPVNKGKYAAERYNSVIDTSVPRKDNSSRLEILEGHYLLRRVKLFS